MILIIFGFYFLFFIEIIEKPKLISLTKTILNILEDSNQKPIQNSVTETETLNDHSRVPQNEINKQNLLASNNQINDNSVSI